MGDTTAAGRAHVIDTVDGDTQPDTEAASRMSAGQIVIITARWLLIATGFVITLWSPTQNDLDTVRIVLFVLFALAMGNFFLHAHVLRRRNIEPWVLYSASTADFAMITLIVWRTGGLESGSFVYYYPAFLALSLVFPLRMVSYFAVGVVLAYVVVALPGSFFQTDLQVLVTRLISLLAVAVVGVIYQTIEQRRRERLVDLRPSGLRAAARQA